MLLQLLRLLLLSLLRGSPDCLSRSAAAARGRGSRRTCGADLRLMLLLVLLAFDGLGFSGTHNWLMLLYLLLWGLMLLL